MKVLRTLEESHASTAVALGFFDGVHIAHQQVLNAAIAFKHARYLIPTVLTFSLDTMPENKKDIKLIYPDKIRLEVIQRQGIEQVYIPPFGEISNLSPETFFKEILINRLHARVVVCGYNYTFGKDGAGTTDDMMDFCENAGIEFLMINPCKKNGELVSSTRLRQYLFDGNVKKANDMMGSSYFVKTNVIKGNQLGKTLGFPTINLPFEENQLVPKFGVYRSVIYIGNDIYRGITNIGIHPTVGKRTQPIMETHIINENLDLYGECVVVSLEDFIREEIKFDSIEQLKEQIQKDLDRA